MCKTVCLTQDEEYLMKKILCGMWKKVAAFCVKKNVIVSAKRYGIDAMGAMAQGLFASLLIGTIIGTLGQQFDIPVLVEIGKYAKAVAGPAMAVSIGYALQAPQFPQNCQLAYQNQNPEGLIDSQWTTPIDFAVALVFKCLPRLLSTSHLAFLPCPFPAET